MPGFHIRIDLPEHDQYDHYVWKTALITLTSVGFAFFHRLVYPADANEMLLAFLYAFVIQAVLLLLATGLASIEITNVNEFRRYTDRKTGAIRNRLS